MIYLDVRRDTRYGAESLERFCNGFTFEIKEYGFKNPNRIQTLHSLVLDNYCLLYIVSGSLLITAGEATSQFDANSLLLFEPFMQYTIKLHGSQNLSFCQIAFDVKPAYNHEAFLAMVFARGKSLSLPESMPDFGPQMNVLFHTQASENCPQIHALLSEVMKQAFSTNSAVMEYPSLRMTAERELAKRALEYIDEHIHLPLKVANVSAHLGVSDSYLYKAFLHLVAVPPGRYILQEKAKAAARLLCVERYAIGEVAKAMGYSSLFHFSKSFKNIYGLSPRAYTKAILRRDYLV